MNEGTIVRAFKPSVALAIVVVSILGTATGYMSTRSGSKAADEEWRAIADLTLREQIATASYFHASSDLRAYTLQEQAEREAAEFERQADATADPSAAARLRDEALALRRLVTRDLSRYFAVAPDQLDTFDFGQFRIAAEGGLKDFHGAFDPDTHDTLSAQAGDVAGGYRTATIIFAASFFFLSMAELTRRRLRMTFVTVGTLIAASGVFAWITT